ncbi:MAG: hypothetical protein QG626_397 [Patescibacteria group bacterium]|jgi:tRNA (Thr-GGU) A37 N-methylase|nr:hypothetical protein [Patescibacteria group bacterium]
MQVYDSPAGETLVEAAEKMIQIAIVTDSVVTCEYNQIELIARSDSRVDDIERCYREERNRQNEAYRNSPKAQQKVAEARAELEGLQRVMDEGMTELEMLDFTDLLAVVNWFEKVRSAAERDGVNCPAKEIVAKFSAHGYEPVVDIKAYNAEDEGSVARHLINNALDFLDSSGHIHQVISHKIDDWKLKFGHNVN